jgi:hypothetical protein
MLVVSALQISVKVRDWIWAGRMTADGARLVDTATAPSCGTRHVVFLTEPVAVHGVYTHFYYETFELARGCMPAVFQVLIRVMRQDGSVEVKWDGPSRIVITAPAYRDNFVASRDLRNFDRPISGAARSATVSTPLGQLRAEPVGGSERLTLTLAPEIGAERPLFFYYSDGRMWPLPLPVAGQNLTDSRGRRRAHWDPARTAGESAGTDSGRPAEPAAAAAERRPVAAGSAATPASTAAAGRAATSAALRRAAPPSQGTGRSRDCPAAAAASRH